MFTHQRGHIIVAKYLGPESDKMLHLAMAETLRKLGR